MNASRKGGSRRLELLHYLAALEPRGHSISELDEFVARRAKAFEELDRLRGAWTAEEHTALREGQTRADQVMRDLAQIQLEVVEKIAALKSSRKYGDERPFYGGQVDKKY